MTDEPDEPAPVRLGREVLARPVADYAGQGQAWELYLQCAGSCPGQKRLVADLARTIRPGLTWAEVVPRLRCVRCGEPASIVGLAGPPPTPGYGREWLLLQRGEGPWR